MNRTLLRVRVAKKLHGLGNNCIHISRSKPNSARLHRPTQVGPRAGAQHSQILLSKYAQHSCMFHDWYAQHTILDWSSVGSESPDLIKHIQKLKKVQRPATRLMPEQKGKHREDRKKWNMHTYFSWCFYTK